MCIVQSWKEIVRHGNQCFDQRRWYDAQALYYSAIEQLERLWSGDKENIQLMMGWIAAMHNLASLYEEQGREKSALQPLMTSYKTIMTLKADGPLNDEFSYYVTKATRITLLAIIEFSKKHPICDCCKAGLEASWQELQTTQNVLH